MRSKVKQFVLWLLVLFAWAVPAGALETNLMMHTDGGYLYIVKFVYATDTYTIPATYPPGPPHYDAEITVTEARSNAMVEVCPPWRGYYTARKCYEDEPAAVVRQALARRWRRRVAHTDPEPKLTAKAMRELGFSYGLAPGGKCKCWNRRGDLFSATYLDRPTATELFYDAYKCALNRARRKWKAAIKEALELNEPVIP